MESQSIYVDMWWIFIPTAFFLLSVVGVAISCVADLVRSITTNLS